MNTEEPGTLQGEGGEPGFGVSKGVRFLGYGTTYILNPKDAAELEQALKEGWSGGDHLDGEQPVAD